MGRRAARVRLVIVDEYELVRAGLRAMLAGEADLAVVGEAGTSEEAVSICRTLRPDVVLMDIGMPPIGGGGAAAAIREASPETRVVIVTSCEDPDRLLEALRVGAVGYLLKSATRAQVASTIRHILRGEVVLNHELMARLFARLAPESPRAAGASPLSARERSVVRLLAQGQTNRDIARSLELSMGTVKIHVEHIIEKLGVADRTAAAARAAELGLLGPPDREG